MLDYKGIAGIFEEIELLLIRSLKRNIGRHKQEEQQENFQWTAWQAEKLRSLDKFRRENAAIMNEYTDIIDRETRQLMEEQFKEGMNGVTAPQSETISDTTQVVLTPEPKFFGVENTKVTKLMDDVVNLEKHAETAVLRTMDDVYRQTVHKAQLAMSTGMPLQKAIDMSVKDFLDKGINCIVYRDGRRVNIADYVRMALNTTSTRAALQGKAARIKAMWYDTVRVTKYSMCSDTCLPWQGRPYIDDVFSLWDGEIEERENGELWGKSNYCGKWFPLLSTALHGGLFHPNCRHSISLYVDGDTLPKALDNSEIEKRYKLEQKMRRLENNIRRAKRKAEGFSDPDNIKKAQRELREAQKKLREFIDQVNNEYGKIILKRDSDGREKIYDENRVDKYPNSDIIELVNKKQEIPEEVVNDINKAVDKVAEDFPDIKKQVEPIEFADISPDLGVNGFLNGRAVNVIKLSKDYCSDYLLLRQKLLEDFINHISYETDNVGSLTCHELGHAIHKILALKRVGIKYGELLTPIKEELFKNEMQKIGIEIYNAAFTDESYEVIVETCERELGSMVTGKPGELIAQSFGNYYYGNKKSIVAKSIVEYFMRELM